MQSIGRFLSGFFFGTLIGAGLGLLLSPYSGEDNRTSIVRYVDRVKAEMQAAMVEKRVEQERELAQLRQPKEPLPE